MNHSETVQQEKTIKEIYDELYLNKIFTYEFLYANETLLALNRLCNDFDDDTREYDYFDTLRKMIYDRVSTLTIKAVFKLVYKVRLMK